MSCASEHRRALMLVLPSMRGRSPITWPSCRGPPHSPEPGLELYSSLRMSSVEVSAG
jgi:hypothetical protein